MSPELRSCGLRPLRPAEHAPLRAALAEEGLPVEDLETAFSRFFALEEDGRLLGYAGLELHEHAALLRSVVVAREARRRGVGRRLVEAMLAQAALLGVQEIYLLTNSAADFFKRLGFSRIERGSAPPGIADSAEFTRLCPASAQAMMRHLP
ncbi:MAG TPA: arsenic resistance N-acetyltransferase ArsN2 [Alphaproteobacteria bacterium]|nr:arsenic resistance N-acetyltransferase ArsN2 [Alphaproteobacteria bacterium]